VFPEPEKFKPERFIGEDGQFRPHPRVLPFGVGRRRCLGESLARMSLYTFLTNIVAKFTIVPAGEMPEGAIYGLIRSPHAYEVKFMARS